MIACVKEICYTHGVKHPIVLRDLRLYNRLILFIDSLSKFDISISNVSVSGNRLDGFIELRDDIRNANIETTLLSIADFADGFCGWTCDIEIQFTRIHFGIITSFAIEREVESTPGRNQTYQTFHEFWKRNGERHRITGPAERHSWEGTSEEVYWLADTEVEDFTCILEAEDKLAAACNYIEDARDAFAVKTLIEDGALIATPEFLENLDIAVAL